MSDFKTWKILPDGPGWVIRCQDELDFESHHNDKMVAVDAAKQLAMDHRPSQVVIHGSDGSVVAAVHYNGLEVDGESADPSTTDQDMIGRAV